MLVRSHVIVRTNARWNARLEFTPCGLASKEDALELSWNSGGMGGRAGGSVSLAESQRDCESRLRAPHHKQNFAKRVSHTREARAQILSVFVNTCRSRVCRGAHAFFDASQQRFQILVRNVHRRSDINDIAKGPQVRASFARFRVHSPTNSP